MEELYAMDADSLKALAPVHGLVFLFKYTGEPDDRSSATDAPPTLFFAKQVATNACATQAILAVLLNAAGVTLGGPAAQLKEFCVGVPPDVAGMALAACVPIRIAHNSFTPPTPLLQEDKTGPSDDAFHFVAYVPVGGDVYELDGLRSGPLRVAAGVGGGDAWLDAVAPVLAARVARYAASEVRFNLMAVVGDRLAAAQERVAALEAAGADAATLADARSDVDAAAALRARWTADNERRKHNALPFMFSLLRELAGRGQLGAFLERAKVEAS